MLSRSFIIVLGVALLGAAGWTIFILEKEQSPGLDPMIFVPENATFIWKIAPGHNPDFGRESLALADLIDPKFEAVRSWLMKADSIRQQDPLFQQALLRNSAILSFHPDDSGGDWQFTADGWTPAGSHSNSIGNLLEAGTFDHNIGSYSFKTLVTSGSASALIDSALAQVHIKTSQSQSAVYFKKDTSWLAGEFESLSGETIFHLLDHESTDASISVGIQGNVDEILPASTHLLQSFVLERTAQFNSIISDIEDSCACDVTAFMVDEVSSHSMFEFEGQMACALHYPALLDRLNSFSQLVGPTIDQEYGYPIFRFDHPAFFNALGYEGSLRWMTYAHDHLIAIPSREMLSKYLSVLSTGHVVANSNPSSSSLPSGHISEAKAFADDWFPLNLEGATVRYYPSAPQGQYIALAIQKQTSSSASDPGGPMWVTPCDGLSQGPWLVKNHYTNEGEILWQDNAHGLHLISASGQELWSATVDGQVMGAVEQIDIYKNGKLQLVFNTAGSIYCLDRNGRLVENFPIRLPSNASCPLAVVDYDSDRDYRLVQGVEGGEILNFKVDGKMTRGWNFRKSETDIRHVEHIRIRAKDYVFALEDNGEIHLLKRGGGSRYKSKAKAVGHRGENIHFVKGSTIGTTRMMYPDDSGNIVSLQFDQDFADFGLTGLSAGSSLSMSDINNDRELDFVVADGREIKAYDSKYNRLFTTELPAPITFGPKIFSFSKVDKKIGVVSENQMYLIDSQGVIDPDFPKPGNDGFLIYDLDRNGSMEVVGALNGALVTTRL